VWAEPGGPTLLLTAQLRTPANFGTGFRPWPPAPIRNLETPPDPIEDDIAEALTDPEFSDSLDEYLAAEARGEPEPTYSTEEVWAHLQEERRKRAGR
jgi:hypothetical protein